MIARGNQRQKTFTSDIDYRTYIERLARYRKKYDYKLHKDGRDCARVEVEIILMTSLLLRCVPLATQWTDNARSVF